MQLAPRDHQLANAHQLAADQHGVIRRSQALRIGVPTTQVDWLVRTRRWIPVAHEVFRVAGAAATVLQLRSAATLAAWPGAALSHLTSGDHLHLERAPRRPELDVTVPYGRSARKRRVNIAADERAWSTVRMHRSLAIDPIDLMTVEGIPCTSATRTLIDCAPLVSEETLEVMFESARRMGLLSTSVLADRVAALGGKGRAGCGAIRDLLARQAGVAPAESTLEVKLWRLIRDREPARTDIPTRQHETVRSDGARARIDVAWAPLQFGIEAEGWEWHSGRIRWKRDRRRAATLETAGWRLLFVTWDDVVNHPAETLARIASAYAERCATHGTPLR